MNGVHYQGIYGLIGKGGAKEDTDIKAATVDMGRVTVKGQHWSGGLARNRTPIKAGTGYKALASGTTPKEVSKSS